MISKNLIARIAVAVVAIPVILKVSYKGGDWLFGMVAVFAAVGLYEFLYNEGYRLRHLLFYLAYLTVGGMFLAQYGNGLPGLIFIEILFNSMSGLLLFFILSGVILAAGKKTPAELFTQATRLVWGVFYIGVLYPFVYLLGTTYNQSANYTIPGGDWLLFLFGILWVGDTAAMFVGKMFGKHKLAPTVSPNKTVEGFIGGIIGALIIGVVMFYWKFDKLTLVHCLSIAALCSVFGQLGDLVESMWKRSLNIKDSSAIIPGHGGILDRFDSLLFAAPVMFYYKLLILY